MPLEERWGLGEGGEWQGNEKKKGQNKKWQGGEEQ